MPNHNAPYVAASDTSRARAQREDTNGTTRTRRTELLTLLRVAGPRGATWADLSAITLYHHGQISGALSKLHENGDVFQLRETRNGCHPYVHAEYRADYPDNEVNDEPVKTRAGRRADLLEAVAAAAHELCVTQSSNAAAKWNALRAALAELKETN